ncbi:FG-GAP repeat protein [Acinetobacter sp. WCHAc060025]|uniref:FG-GAP repeat protein n=1 Tax=Acinetobacter sp. WCHAc060025 TaxID=2518625 RepID=UPI001022AE01|nr:FG-GAP repeat protein [Acinetobacter sp. WCHAc060025]RZG77471.1 hypothetical protein EXE09_03450 [Acinetobacter sp. WCHAc060025]
MMKKPIPILHCFSMLILMFFAESLHAQLYEIKNGSKLYDVQIETQYALDQMSGKAIIHLSKKNSKQVFQTFHSDELTLSFDQKAQPQVNVAQIYGEQSAILFGDFNFDGTQDIAISNGNYGSYGGPVYDIYVFNQTKGNFILSEELSVLTQENLGMFELDQKRKRLMTFNKSGCCYHIRSEYEVVPNKGLLLVREFIEAVVTAGDKVEVTDRNLVKGRWREKTKYYPTEQYYK